MTLHMLTTIDNPFDPYTQFNEWYAFDTQHGYNTSAYLSRILRTSDELSIPDQDAAMEEAIDEIVRLNVRGVYIKITAEDGRAIREKSKRIVKHSEDRLVHISKAIDELDIKKFNQERFGYWTEEMK